MSYLAKSDYEYCYEWDGDVKGDYKHPYFIGSPDVYYSYLHEKIQQLKDYCSISSNIMNWEIYDTIDVLFNGFDQNFYGYNDLSNQLYYRVLTPISSYGYTILGTENLGSEIDSVKGFIETKISLRLTYLTNSLQSLIQQARDMESYINSADSTLNTVL